MADTSDEGRFRGVKVNQRELTIDIVTGQIVKGPPALLHHWLCVEQVADLLAGGAVIEHLYTAETEVGVRLARVDYLTARDAERRGSFSIGSHVRFGRHGVFRISGLDSNSDEYQLTAGDRTFSVPRTRVDSEAVAVDPKTPRHEVHVARNFAPEVFEQEEVSGEHDGDIQIDDVELATLIGQGVRDWIRDNRDEVIQLLSESLGQERE